MVVYMSTILDEFTKEDGQIIRVTHRLEDDGLSILQHDDDIILFMDHDLGKIKKNRNSFL
jgi:hypothetical protein